MVGKGRGKLMGPRESSKCARLLTDGEKKF